MILLSLILSVNLVWAHGEDKPGPNGGYLRMPGAFHTEVVPEGKNKLKIFLLDLHWKNPSTDKSKIQVQLKSKKIFKAKCTIKENYYLCEFSNKINLAEKGKLFIIAEREGQKGIEVTYPLPFKYEVVNYGASSSQNEHGGHH